MVNPRDKHGPSNADVRLTEAELERLRGSIGAHLIADPGGAAGRLDDCVGRIELAIGRYRGHVDAGGALPEEAARSPGFDSELDRVVVAARALVAAVEDLSDTPRAHILGTTWLDPAAADRLLELCGLAESAASSVKGTASGPIEPVQRTEEHAALFLIESLAIVWEAHTREHITRDDAARSPFAGFVALTCEIVGIDRTRAHTLRVRAYETMSLAESAALLASLPDDI